VCIARIEKGEEEEEDEEEEKEANCSPIHDLSLRALFTLSSPPTPKPKGPVKRQIPIRQFFPAPHLLIWECFVPQLP
jgi:hypothetical protein